MTALTAEQEEAFMRYFPTANIAVADSHRARRIFQAGWQARLSPEAIPQGFSEWYEKNYRRIAATSSWVERARMTWEAAQAEANPTPEAIERVARRIQELEDAGKKFLEDVCICDAPRQMKGREVFRNILAKN